MGIFSFLQDVGKKLVGSSAASSDDLKKELDSHKLGTDSVNVTVDNGKVVLTGEVKDQSTFEKTVLAVGNAFGISEVNAEKLAVGGANPGDPVFYTVKSGDNLWKIAEAHYGKGQGEKHTVIFEANKPMLTSPDKIYPGQMLRIPPLK